MTESGAWVDVRNEVTFGDFARLAKRRDWSPEFLAERFQDKIEKPSEFFHRVMEGRYANVVIPYRSVLSFYFTELKFQREEAGTDERLCACGCGIPVLPRKKWASETCRKKVQRKKGHGQPKGGSVSA